MYGGTRANRVESSRVEISKPSPRLEHGSDVPA